MKYIVVDLEMNPLSKVYKEEREICNNEIIEIGAVVLDENYNEIGSFKTIVKPRLNSKIETKVEKLTGITTDMVSSAPFFEDAVGMFFTWCDSIKENIQILQWSDSDYAQLEKEMHLKGYKLTVQQEKLFTNWYDFQKEFGETLGLERQLSLKKALMYAGIDFEGKEHDALFDARNTATLVTIVRTPELCKQALDNVINALTPKSINVSLGDMFDFSQLSLSAQARGAIIYVVIDFGNTDALCAWKIVETVCKSSVGNYKSVTYTRVSPDSAGSYSNWRTDIYSGSDSCNHWNCNIHHRLKNINHKIIAELEKQRRLISDIEGVYFERGDL